MLTREEAALRAAAEAVAESVVQIRTIGGLDTVDGTLLADGPTTGLVISADGYIVSSAFNFVQQPASILVTFPSGKQAPAELVATDHSRMIVLLKVSGVADLPVPTMAPIDDVRPGQWAIAVGRTFRADRVNVSVGIVSAVGRMFGKAIQTDADVSTACYGGPLIDIRGRVLGLIVPMAPQAASEVAGAEWYDSGIGFAVPLSPLAERIEQMKKGQDQRPGLLGIGMAGKNPHSSLAELAAVRPDSPAGQAGLKKGDRITEIDGKPIRTQTDLRFALGPRYAGESVQVSIKRGDEQLDRTITLIGELPPFRHAFLGILPIRPEVVAAEDKADVEKNDDENAAEAGVTVRMVYAGSPAEEAGIKPGDRLTRINDSEIKSVNDAHSALNNLAPGSDVNIKLDRNGESVEVLLKAARMPTSVPAELPPAFAKATDETADDKGAVDETAVAKTGETRELKLAEFPHQCKVYVPPSHDSTRPHAALLWLHPPGELNADDVIRQWQNVCDRDGVLLVVPKAADENRWERTELEYLRRLTERVVAEYAVDPHRVVICGQDGGGAMAWLLGLASRDVFRGIAALAAPLPRQAKVPLNEPSQRLAILAAMPAAKESAAQIARGLNELSDSGYPVTTISATEKSGKLTDAQRDELARWIDTLDRL
ncbi:MAG: PDZ domain-containing protein [Planctomycetes bacterium]|nr:PDZ domain-containing protein [Planctomycetota bacterium]